MSSSWRRVGPNLNDWCPYKKRTHRHTDGGAGPVKTEVETGAMKPRIVRSHQELEVARKDSSLEASEGARPCGH